MGFAQVSNAVKNPGSILDIFKPSDVLVGGVKIDVLISEETTHDYVLTKRPVEVGANVNDHREEQPYGLVIEGIVTDDVLEVSLTSALSLLDGVQTWQDKKKKFEEIRDSSERVIVETPFGIHTEMSIKSFKSGHTKDTANALFFRMSLEKVRIVENAVSIIGPDDIPDNLKAKETDGHDSANKLKKGAKKGGSKVADTATEGSSSVLNNLIGGFF